MNPLFPYSALNRICLPSFPTGPLSRVYNHLPTTAINHYFRLSCNHLQSFVKKADHFSLHLTAVDAVLTLDANQSSLSSASVLTTVQASIQCLTVCMSHSSSFLKAHLTTSLWLFQMPSPNPQNPSTASSSFLLGDLLYFLHDENSISGCLARHEVKLHVINWHLILISNALSITFICCSSNLIALYEQHTSGAHFPLYTGTQILLLQSSGIQSSLTLLLIR